MPLAALAANAVADITVEITEGGVARTPIAVVPFGWEGQGAGMPLDIAEVIAADLQRSGRFAPIAEENMLQKPTTGAEVDFDDWSFVKAEAVVVGKVEQTGDNAYTVSFQLFDVFRRQQLVGYRIPASRGHDAPRRPSCCRYDLREAYRHQRRLRDQGRLRNGRGTAGQPRPTGSL